MPCESLHAVVSCGLKPWFDAFVGTRPGAGKDAGGGGGGGEVKLRIPMTKENFAALELRSHLHQNVAIPETNLVIHPAFQRVVE